MTKMKPGKYVGHKFTKDQEQARKLWRRATEYQSEIRGALHVIDWLTRADLHKRLDQRLDAIEKIQAHARELFADVDESFTVATMSIKL